MLKDRVVIIYMLPNLTLKRKIREERNERKWRLGFLRIQKMFC